MKTIRQETRLLITCEHGGNDVPAPLQVYFESPDAKRQLNSHRGYDPGALIAAEKLSLLLAAPLEFSTVSRLVVDLNRSLESAQLFSKFLADQDQQLRFQILRSYYHPYRQRVADAAAQLVAAGFAVLHISVHTFTPRFRGTKRRFDIGVLFDPEREWESRIGEHLVSGLAASDSRSLANEPYLGIDDGLTTSLRSKFADCQYSGIELELNNRFSKRSENTQAIWCERIAGVIRSACAVG